MAYASDLVRTKNWGSEVLTDSDLEAQLDLIINWVMAAMNATTGHDHTATANKGPKINLASAVTIASQAQGDILYASSASALARLGAGTKGKCLTTGGASANPTWEGMTTQGDIEYHDGTTRARLGTGTVGQILSAGGAGANPSWSTLIGSAVDKSGGYANQQAATAGIVVAHGASTSASSSIKGYTDAANPTTQLIAQSDNNYHPCITFPVKRGDHWKVVITDISSVAVWFFPIGA